MEMKIIRQVVEKETGINLDSPKTNRDVVYARTIYFKLCRVKTNKTLSQIGKSLNKHHSSVLHAINNIWPYIMAYNEVFSATYYQIAEKDELVCCEDKLKELKQEYMKLAQAKGLVHTEEVKRVLTKI